jgi:hypothetical protein
MRSRRICSREMPRSWRDMAYEASGSSFGSVRPSPKRSGWWSVVNTLMSLTTITTVGGWGRLRPGRRPRALRALLTAATVEMMVKASSTCTTSRLSPPFLTSTFTSHRGVATCVTPPRERRGAVMGGLASAFSLFSGLNQRLESPLRRKYFLGQDVVPESFRSRLWVALQVRFPCSAA